MVAVKKLLRNEPFAFVSIDELRPFPGHARLHSAAKHNKLKRSVETFGQVMPILVDEHNVIVDGHELFEVLKELRFDEVAVAIVSGRSDVDVRALRLAINRLSDEADWDVAKLRREFEDLGVAGFNIELTGFDVPEVDFALDFAHSESAPANSDFRSPPPVTVTRPGDLWICDGHRIACIDWRSADLTRLLDGRKASATIFRFLNDRADGDPVICGAESTPLDRGGLYQGCKMLADQTDERGVAYAWISWREIVHLFAAADSHGLRPIQICVSGKPSHVAGQLYRECADFVAVLARAACADKVRLSAHGRNRSNVWRHRGTDAVSEDDAYAPSLAGQDRTLICDLMRDSTKRRGIVFDPVLATGTTLLAAEETGRLCFGADKGPDRIDAAIRQWQSETGRSALRASDNETFSQCESNHANGGS
jgi:hypothetical protein